MPNRHSTQFAVGAAGETDRDIFETVADSYEKYHPARVYYSAFYAISDTPLETHENTPVWRANRWYQLDALLRLYGYSRRELAPAFDEDGMLLNTDPKILLAQNLPLINPDTADKAELLRVPGIGAVSAEAIVQTRKVQSVRDTSVLRCCGVVLQRALPYLSLGKTRQTKLSSWC